MYFIPIKQKRLNKPNKLNKQKKQDKPDKPDKPKRLNRPEKLKKPERPERPSKSRIKICSQGFYPNQLKKQEKRNYSCLTPCALSGWPHSIRNMPLCTSKPLSLTGSQICCKGFVE
jgi:hypothetical protein